MKEGQGNSGGVRDRKRTGNIRGREMMMSYSAAAAALSLSKFFH